MPNRDVLGHFMEPLLAGDRMACRAIVHKQLSRVKDARRVCFDLLWPAMEQVEGLYRTHRIDTASEHMATRITRALADQVQAAMVREDPNGKRMLITCADGEPEELGAQMAADLFEAAGWDVYFVGGGVPHDEILSRVGQLRPVS